MYWKRGTLQNSCSSVTFIIVWRVGKTRKYQWNLFSEAFVTRACFPVLSSFAIREASFSVICLSPRRKMLCFCYTAQTFCVSVHCRETCFLVLLGVTSMAIPSRHKESGKCFSHCANQLVTTIRNWYILLLSSSLREWIGHLKTRVLHAHSLVWWSVLLHEKKSSRESLMFPECSGLLTVSIAHHYIKPKRNND